MSYEPVARERIYENLHERLYESKRGFSPTFSAGR
jgi:hypothetical protein